MKRRNFFKAGLAAGALLPLRPHRASVNNERFESDNETDSQPDARLIKFARRYGGELGGLKSKVNINRSDL